MNVHLDLNDHLKVELVRVQDHDETSSESSQKLARTQTELQVQLIDKKAQKATVLAKKTVRWPIGQTLPTQMSYRNIEEELLVQGPTSEAVIPLPKSKIDSLTATAIAKSGSSSKSKTFSAFAVNPIETFDVQKITKAVQNAIETPEKEKKWRSLTKVLTDCAPGDTIGALSAVEQSQLLEALAKYVDDVDSEDEYVNGILNAVAASKILNFRAEDVFLRMCVEKEKTHIVEVVMKDKNRVVSEYILAELLKLAVSKPTPESRRLQVNSVLSRSFSKPAMREACSEVLTAAESIEIMTELAEIYKEPYDKKTSDVSGKALTLITVLMDAHGSRIVYEDKLHTKFAAISNFIIEMQSLIGTFARLEASIEETSDFIPNYNVVYRFNPVAHDLTW